MNNALCVFLSRAGAENRLSGGRVNAARGRGALWLDKSHPQGCLIVQGALTCSEAGQAIKDTLINRRRDGEIALCERLQRAKDEGICPDAEPLLLARYVGTVLQGMAVQATSGICRNELRKVAELVLANFPRNDESWSINP